MATILFALSGETDRLRNFDGSQSLIPLGREGEAVLYSVRPNDTTTRANLEAFYGEAITFENGNEILIGRVSAETMRRLDTLDLPFNESIKLIGHTVEQTASEAKITLTWQLTAPVDLDYTAFVHLLDENGNIVMQQDRQPAGFPTSDWRVGEIVQDTFVLPLPRGRLGCGQDSMIWRLCSRLGCC